AIAGDIFTNTTANPLTVVYSVPPISGAGCAGDPINITLTVNPEPVVSSSFNATVCSDVAGGITLNTNGLSVGATAYDITATVAGGLTGTATTGNGLAADAIEDDIFTNTTNASLTVVYHVTPLNGSCAGNVIDVTLTIQPAPVVSTTLNRTVCSDDVNGITLATNGTSIEAASYNITGATVGAGLVGTATTGNGLAANAIFNDVFTNTTSGNRTVQYTVVPVSASGCVGNARTVVLTVRPEPVMNASLNKT